MKVLVTGAGGFVGGAIAAELSKNNFEVYALLNQNSSNIGEFENKSKCSVLKADIRDWKSLESLKTPQKFDAVIHAAGLAHQFGERDEQDFWEINVAGTKNIAEFAASKSVEHFILISSVAVYGKSLERTSHTEHRLICENTVCRPEGIYAVTKLESENAAQKVCRNRQLNLNILRLATVIGENDGGNVARLIETIDRGKFFWIGKGDNLKSLIYKTDVAGACLKVLQRGDLSGIFNITADALPMKAVVEEIHRRLGRKNPRYTVPPNILEKLFSINRRTFDSPKLERLAETVRKWLSEDVFSGEKFNRTYDFQIQTPITEAIGREVEAYLKSK